MIFMWRIIELLCVYVFFLFHARCFRCVYARLLFVRTIFFLFLSLLMARICTYSYTSSLLYVIIIVISHNYYYCCRRCFSFWSKHLAFIAHKYMNILVPIVECRMLWQQKKRRRKNRKNKLFCFIGRLAFFLAFYMELNTFFSIYF